MFQEHSTEENQSYWERCDAFVEPKHTTRTPGGGATIDPQLEKPKMLKVLGKLSKATQLYKSVIIVPRSPVIPV